jgi:hypothetical protein
MKCLSSCEAFIVGVFLCVAAATNCAAQKTPSEKLEKVDIAYELILSKCLNGNCRLESAVKDKVRIKLEIDRPSFAWGYEGRQIRIGNMTYYFRFKAVHDSKDKFSRILYVGFAGRLGSPENDRQVTWASKQKANTSWNVFPMLPVLGNAYSIGEEIVTPKLEVKVLPESGEAGGRVAHP